MIMAIAIRRIAIVFIVAPHNRLFEFFSFNALARLSVAMRSIIHINFIKRLRRGGVSYANQSIYTPQPFTGLLLRGSR